jgi:hypothetical protein
VGEGWGGGYGEPLQGRLANDFQNTHQIARDLLVREAQYSVTLRRKPRIACCVARLPRIEVVTFTIDFNDETRRMTDEVGDISSYRRLAAKSEIINVVRF